MWWRVLPVLLVPTLTIAACGSSRSGEVSAVGSGEPAAAVNESPAPEPTPIPSQSTGDEPEQEPAEGEEPEPAPVFDCGTAVPSAELLASPPSSVEETREQLPLMHELFRDTVLLREEIGISVNHMMIDGLPTILVQTGDAAGRCEQILETVAHPNRVLFVEWTEEDYGDALDRGLPPWRLLIETDVGKGSENPLWISMGTGRFGVTSLTLRTDQEDLAATLLDRYEELIKVSVGNFAFPAERIDPDSRSWCQALPEGGPPADVTIRSATLHGDVFTGEVEVVVANDGTSTVHLVPNRIAELTGPGSSALVSAFREPQSAEERGSIRLDPGAETAITATPSTASCSADVGYALPTGRYDFVLPIHVFDSEAFEGDVSDRVLLARVEIELE